MKATTYGTQENAIASIRSTNGQTFRHKSLPIAGVVREYTAGGRACFALWIGKAIKPSAYYSASSIAVARKNLEILWKNAEKGLADRAARLAEKAEKLAAIKAADHFTAGDVLVNSWGYDQTNVDFYQVTHVGEKSIKVRAIRQKSSMTHLDGGLCQPDRFNFAGPELRKTVNARGEIRFEFGGCRKWDGRAVGWTTGH